MRGVIGRVPSLCERRHRSRSLRVSQDVLARSALVGTMKRGRGDMPRPRFIAKLLSIDDERRATAHFVGYAVFDIGRGTRPSPKA